MAGGAIIAVALGVGLVWATRSAGPSSLAEPSPTPEASEAPTPAPFPNVWRIDGIVLDDQNKPIEGVCVGLGPGICTDVNPRTDAKGRWHMDLPKVSVDYEFHFTKPGFKQFDMTARLVTPQTFTIHMTR